MYTLIFLAVCEGSNTEMNTAGTACVCVADAYQTNADQSDQPLQCATCPFGSTTGRKHKSSRHSCNVVRMQE